MVWVPLRLVDLRIEIIFGGFSRALPSRQHKRKRKWRGTTLPSNAQFSPPRITVYLFPTIAEDVSPWGLMFA